MKHVMIPLILATGAAAWFAAPMASAETPKRASAPVVITPPAIPDGSDFSRAPFPAARPQNDVTPPNGQAFDQNLPPNTPGTTPAPIPPPVPTLAVLQPHTAPGLMPTGRPSIAASAALAPQQVEPMIRDTDFANRGRLIDSLRLRERQTETALVDFDHTQGQMSAEGRTQFKPLFDTARQRQDALDKSLHAAADASAGSWDQARAQLLADYDAYAAAAKQVDIAVGVAPPAP